MIATTDLSPAKLLTLTIFDSDLGWFALLGQDGIPAELTFGHGSPDAALRRLSKQHVLAEVADWPTDLPERLQRYAAGDGEEFSDVAVELPPLGAFAAAVVRACREIPFGQTRTYGELAALAGSPRAARAVGNVMATNRLPLIIPCHRVVPAGGKLGRYSAGEGTRTKLRLLETEAQLAGVSLAPLRV